MNAHTRIVIGSCIAAIFLPVLAVAQSELATLTGTVTDPSTAILAGVSISVTNEETGVIARSTTTPSGRYVIPGLRPGVYKLEASHPSFKQFNQSGITLQVNQVARLDFTLEIGDVAERVSVRGEASVLEVESSASIVELKTERAVMRPYPAGGGGREMRGDHHDGAIRERLEEAPPSSPRHLRVDAKAAVELRLGTL